MRFKDLFSPMSGHMKYSSTLGAATFIFCLVHNIGGIANLLYLGVLWTWFYGPLMPNRVGEERRWPDGSRQLRNHIIGQYVLAIGLDGFAGLLFHLMLTGHWWAR